MKRKETYERPDAEALEMILENSFAYPQPNQSYEEDPNEFLFD